MSDLHRLFFFCLLLHRNLGKSGLRVSCLGLGESAWRQENIHLCFSRSNETNVSVSPLAQAPGWHLDHRSLMRWEFCRLSLFVWELQSTFAHIAFVENTLCTVSTNLSVFNYRHVSKSHRPDTWKLWWHGEILDIISTVLSSLHSALHGRPLGNWNLSTVCPSQSQFSCSPRWLRTWWP